MALFAFDGTWNQAKNDDSEYRNTNVRRFFDAYHANTGNTHDCYKAGVATRLGVVGRIVGGVFGAGELVRLNEAYDQLCLAWAEGDQVIDIVGFSRGAATTLDFCHIIQDRGIRKPGGDTVVEPNHRSGFWVSGTSSRPLVSRTSARPISISVIICGFRRAACGLPFTRSR